MDIHLNLDSDTAAQAFPSEPLWVEHDASVRNVLRLMRDENVGAVLVRRRGKLAGIFTERDALGLMANDADMETPIDQVMTRDLDTLSHEDSVAEAISKMSQETFSINIRLSYVT